MYARRSDVGATAWGKTVTVKGPAGSDDLWELAASAQSGRLDIVGLFTRGSSEILYHTQLRPGLDVAVSPAKASVGHGFTAKVMVKDAVLALAGAKVTIAGRSASTNASGVAKVKVAARKSAGTLAVTVTKSGYAQGSASIRVVR